MALGRSVCSRIRNARNSLDNAERSFRSNQEIRGELDLMLAEAELENLRQKRSGWVSWSRHLLAVCFAVLVLAAGGLGWWWASSYGGNTTNAAGLQTEGTVKEPSSQAMKSQEQDIRKEPESPGVKQEKAYTQPLPAVQDDRDTARLAGSGKSGNVSLSSRQMYQLIRSGKQELGSARYNLPR